MRTCQLQSVGKVANPGGAVNGGAFHAPPLTAPPGLARRSSSRTSPRGACPTPLILGGVRWLWFEDLIEERVLDLGYFYS